MHALETYDNGETAFVSAHTDAWHRLGTTLDHSFTAEEAMRHGLLGGWDVRKQPLLTPDGNGELLEIEDRRAVVRTDPTDPKRTNHLGIVGKDYQIVQNEEHAGFLNALVDESGAHFDTAGSLHGGRQVFITMRMPGHISVGGVDQVSLNLAALNSHDGSMSFTVLVTPVRIVCANTMNLAFQNKTNIFRVRHTSGIERAMRTQARQALEMTFNYLDGFQEEAERLINTTMTQSTFEEMIQKEFGAPADAPQVTISRCENKIEQMTRLFADSMTHEGVRETAWAGLNALTEWADHYSPVRGDDRDNARASKAVLAPNFKNRALDLVLATV